MKRLIVLCLVPLLAALWTVLAVPIAGAALSDRELADAAGAASSDCKTKYTSSLNNCTQCASYYDPHAEMPTWVKCSASVKGELCQAYHSPNECIGCSDLDGVSCTGETFYYSDSGCTMKTGENSNACNFDQTLQAATVHDQCEVPNCP